MTTTEFSQAFDAQIAAYNNTTAFGESDKSLAFDEYEKSVFLTKAQDDLVLSYYSGKNSYGEGFEHTEEIRRYLASLIKKAELTPTSGTGIIKNSKLFILPKETWFIVYEAIQLDISEKPCLSEKYMEVQPATHDELHRILKNPFRGPTNSRVLRLDLEDNKVEIISSVDNIAKYIIRYIAEPGPIIVEDLYDDLDIKSANKQTECTLHPALHKAILDRAVQLAIASKTMVSNIQK